MPGGNRIRRLSLALAILSMTALGMSHPDLIGQTLFYATPLIFTGLGFALPASAGFLNIGGEGQVLAGGLAAAVVGIVGAGFPSVVLLPSCGLAPVSWTPIL